jgi:hypothetical protein
MVARFILFMIESAPGVVSHEVLIEKFWGPTVNGGDALMKTVSKSRKLFDFEVIRTVSKCGYQWVADAMPVMMNVPPEKRPVNFIPLKKLEFRYVFLALFFMLLVLRAVFHGHVSPFIAMFQCTGHALPRSTPLLCQRCRNLRRLLTKAVTVVGARVSDRSENRRGRCGGLL